MKTAGKIRKFKDFYTLGEKIGAGKFSEVFIGYEKTTTTKVAVKLINRRKLDRFEREMMKNEINILKVLDHPGIVKLIDVFDLQKTLILILEFIPGGELYNKIRSVELSEYIINKIVFQLINIICYMLSVGVIHRDIKPENIILTSAIEDPIIKLIDFGLATYICLEHTVINVCGTIGYSPPEMLLKNPYGIQSDM